MAAVVRVSPPSTQVTQPTRTPEQLQAEAEHNGWIRPENEFSLLYPWYRLHLIAVFDGEDISDAGLAPLGCDILIAKPRLDSWVYDFMNSVARGIFIGYMASEIAVLTAMQIGPEAFAVVFFASVAIKAGLLALAWNSVQDLKSALVATFVSYMLGLVGVVKTLTSEVLNWSLSFIELARKIDFWKFLYKWLYIPINTVFMLIILGRLRQLGAI